MRSGTHPWIKSEGMLRSKTLWPKIGDVVPPPQESRGADSVDAKLPGDPVHGLGELDIQLGDAAGVVGRQHHLYRLVNVLPFRVVVVLLGDQGCAGHEPEGLVEILE